MIVKLKSALREVLVALGLIEPPRLQPIPLRSQQQPCAPRR
ncbi:PA1414 family protein [Pseudomonas sp. N040]|nr:PA1414 family protein [Pseudomonas sp. N040]